jgi:hypothetical protein
MNRMIMLLLVVGLLTAAFGAAKAYEVTPFGNNVAEIVTSPNGGITQYYRNTLDSLTRISWWCGDTFGGGLYKVVVADSANPNQWIAHGPLNGQPATQCWGISGTHYFSHS